MVLFRGASVSNVTLPLPLSLPPGGATGPDPAVFHSFFLFVCQNVDVAGGKRDVSAPDAARKLRPISDRVVVAAERCCHLRLARARATQQQRITRMTQGQLLTQACVNYEGAVAIPAVYSCNFVRRDLIAVQSKDYHYFRVQQQKFTLKLMNCCTCGKVHMHLSIVLVHQ